MLNVCFFYFGEASPSFRYDMFHLQKFSCLKRFWTYLQLPTGQVSIWRFPTSQISIESPHFFWHQEQHMQKVEIKKKRAARKIKAPPRWVVVWNISYFHPYLGKTPILTNILQRAWNHQLEDLFGGEGFGDLLDSGRKCWWFLCFFSMFLESKGSKECCWFWHKYLKGKGILLFWGTACQGQLEEEFGAPRL